MSVSRRVVMLLSNGLRSDPRVEKEAASLSKAGHDVTVIAWDREGGLQPIESRAGFDIERLGPRAAFGAGLRSVTAFRGFWRAAAQRAVALDPDVVHCHDLDTAPAGMRAARATGAKLVLDFHELYRESRMVPKSRAVRPAALAAVDTLERRALRQADLVLVANPPTLAHYAHWARCPVVELPNAPDAEMFRPSMGSRTDRPFTVCYIGQKRYVRALEMLVDIVARHGDLAAILAGGGVAEAEIAEYARGVDRVQVVGPVSYSEIPGFYAHGDAVFAIYDTSVGNIAHAYPVKAMEGMACALPVIIDRATAFGQLVADCGCGMVVNGSDVASVESALLRLVSDPEAAEAMGRRGRALIDAGLNWATVSQRLVDAYGSL